MSVGMTVLVVDDEPSVRDALELILSDSGYFVLASMSGRDALGKAHRQRIDVAIVDVELPDMSGLDVLRHLREKDPGLQVIVITANPTPAIVQEARKRGAADCLHKPFHPADIVDAIQSALARP
ncbi:MAG TPA: response regulator [Blastocatellia bacterium]|nr:response regulator [Blastocatellia bacterium]